MSTRKFNWKDGINWKLVGLFFVLVVLSFSYIPNQDAVKTAVRAVLTWKHLQTVIWLSVFSCFFVHYFSVRKTGESYESLIFISFGKFADSAFAAVTYGLALTTSASILKGVYLQLVLNEAIYFNFFDDIDIWSMLVVCLFLFGYSLFETGKAVFNACVRSASADAVGVK